MPTSIDSVTASRAEQPRRRPRGLAAKAKASDPADPRNSDKLLGQLKDEKDADALNMEPFGLWNDDLTNLKDVLPKAKFWDGRSITAASISFACGAVAGVPIGHYLHSIWF